MKCSLSPKLQGIGIDILGKKRVDELFLKHSQSDFQRLFPQSEKSKVSLKHKKISQREFARQFVAKEAFFKALGGSWMGLEGFAAMELSYESDNQFTIQTLPSGKTEHSIRANGTFFDSKDWVGAQVILWR